MGCALMQRFSALAKDELVLLLLVVQEVTVGVVQVPPAVSDLMCGDWRCLAAVEERVLQQCGGAVLSCDYLILPHFGVVIQDHPHPRINNVCEPAACISSSHLEYSQSVVLR